MNAYAIGLISSILIYLVIGSYAGRKIKHLEDYFVAGRSASTLLIVGTLVASYLSTNAFLGETGFSYAGYGTLILILTAVNSVGYVVGALFFGRYIRRSQALTVAEFFGKRFNSRRVQAAAGITIIVGLTAYLLAVTQGASLIVSEVMEIPYRFSLFIVWAGYTLFTFYSGSKGVVITDTIMFLLFTIVAFIALFFIIGESGGWFATIKALTNFDAKPGIISWHGLSGPQAKWQSSTDSLLWAIILGLSWAFVVAISPWQSSRYLMAKNEHTVIRSACIASGSLLILYTALMTCGAAINLHNLNIDPSDKAMIWAALNLMPIFAGVLLMAGLMASALSSASTFLSLVAFSASHDIVNFKTTNEQQKLRFTRYTMLIVGLVILLLAMFQPPAVMWITYFAGTLFASSWGPVAFMSIWSKTITADGAFWGIVTGFIGNITAKLLSLFSVINLPVYLDPFIIGLLLSIMTIMMVSRRGYVTDEEHNYRTKIHETPSEELDPLKLKQTLFWSKVLIVCGCIIIVLMIVFYARPYQSEIDSSLYVRQNIFAGILNMNGEMVLAIGYGFAAVLSGTLAYWCTNKFYATESE
jgi:sodium/pantothenate symporter